MYQCVVCDEYVYTEDVVSRCCGKLRQWINGVPERGINVDSPIVRVNVSGYIEMSKENLERLLNYDDPHMGLVYCIHMGYVKSDNLEFTPEE